MDGTKQRITGKLADKYILHAETEDDLEELKQIRGNPAKVKSDNEELAKTPTEAALIGDCTEALNGVLDIVGLPQVEVDPDFIHLFETAAYESEFGSDSMGRVIHGNVFMKRPDSPGIFCHVLTHELVHLCSYHIVEATLKHADGGLGLDLKIRRHGLGIQGRLDGRPRFRGLDEAATEAMAINVRQILIRSPGALTDDDRDLMGRIVAYPAWMSLLRGLVRLVGQANGPAWATKLLIHDQMGGINRFLRELERLIKGSVRKLVDLSPSTDDALKGAEALGLAEAAEDIRSLISRGY